MFVSDKYAVNYVQDACKISCKYFLDAFIIFPLF
jgi:hypothetical protein